MTFDVDEIAGASTLWLNSLHVEECLAYYRNAGIDILGVNPSRGFSAPDLSFLAQYPDVTGLLIVSPISGAFDLRPVRALRKLRTLIVSDVVPIALREFPELSELRAFWDHRMSLEGCSRLRILDLSKYRPPSGDLTELPELPSLRELSLVQSPLKSLSGIARYPLLRRLELAHLSKLETLAGVEGLPALEVLECAACRRLQGYSLLGEARKLRVLRLNRCADIANLRFIDALPRLEEFRFSGTQVVDGDLTPLLRLRAVGFEGRKHYSHTPKQVQAVLAARIGGTPPGGRG